MIKSDAWKAAWQQCYDYFGLANSEFDLEIASLRLAFYLASFGMFRGSGKTRQLQLVDFAELSVVAREYAYLRGAKPKILAKQQSEVEGLLEALRKKITSLDASPTDTLVTKIALATTGCVPGYDRFVVKALRYHGLTGRPSIKGLAELYALRKEDLARFDAVYEETTPFMRSLDVGLMEQGIALEKKGKLKIR